MIRDKNETISGGVMTGLRSIMVGMPAPPGWEVGMENNTMLNFSVSNGEGRWRAKSGEFQRLQAGKWEW